MKVKKIAGLYGILYISRKMDLKKGNRAYIYHVLTLACKHL